MTRLLALLLLALAISPATRAQERILAYDSSIAIQPDGSMQVEERIRVRAEGTQIRRGIYRDFPTRYRDRHGNAVVVEFTPLEVLRDGQPEPWFTENRSNGVRLNTGNDDFLPTPGEFTFTLRYRTTRQLGFFADHDELYWNAIGTGWVFPIEAGSVELSLPQPVPMGELTAEGYTGAQGTTGQDYTATITAPGQAHWQLTRPLSSHEGFTIVLGFPKGVVMAPSKATRAAWLLKDNRGVLVALATLLILLVFMLRRWHAIGRDPKPGIIIARYEPPAGMSPAALRFIRKMAPDNPCMTADLLALAVAGLVRIEHEKGLLKGSWSLHRTEQPIGSLPPSQRALLTTLFGSGKTLELKNSNHQILQRAKSAQARPMEAAYAGTLFNRNLGSTGLAILIAVTGMVLAILLSGGNGIPYLIAIGIILLLLVIVFAFLIPAPTPEGRKVLDEIEGFKRYLGVAEQQDLATLTGPDQPPQLDAERFQRLLPYAVALGVEEAWSRKFTLAVGAAAAATAMAGYSWYRGSSFSDVGSFTKAMGSSLGSSIASASTPPGSSSGGGGGGSSGGGGGGGGGGGR